MSFGSESDESASADEAGDWRHSRHSGMYNLEAEQAVLGGIILDPEQFDLTEGRISEDDFFSAAHRLVFEAMQALRRRHQPIDPVLLRNELRDAGGLEAIGGVVGLATLTDAATSGSNVEYYAELVTNAAALRRLQKTFTDSLAKVAEPGASAVEIIGEVESTLRNGADRSFQRNSMSLAEIGTTVWDAFEKHLSGVKPDDALQTGYTHLDELLTGLHEGELVIIAGRPSMGKSTFALNVMRNIAVKGGAPSLFFTLEMSAENIYRNLLAAHARVDGLKMRNYAFSREDRERLFQASGDLQEAPIWVDETPAITLAELRAKARMAQARHGIKLIAVDYLQLMTASNLARGRSREQEVSEISRGLKALAKELRVPLLAMSQLSRKPADRQQNRPILSDLRESGAIEQDADVVLLLHRPDYYKQDEKPGMAEIIIAKQRNGPTDTVDLTFIKNILRFENLHPHAGYVPYGDEK